MPSSEFSLSRRQFLRVAAATAALAALGDTRLGGSPLLERALAAAQIAEGEETISLSYCDMCNHGPKCGLKVFVRDGVITRVESRDNYPNDPPCSKGIAIVQEQYSPARLQYPFKRANPKGEPAQWVRISWDEALDTIATKLNEIKARDGAEKVIFMTGDPKEMRGPLQRLALTFGSPNYGTESSTCARSSSLSGTLLWGVSNNGGKPTPKSKICMIWSANPAWSMAYDSWKLADSKEQGVKFIVVDPRLTPTARNLADIHLQLRPGTDGALAAGMANVAIKENLYDKEFVDKWVQGFDQFKEYVKDYPPEQVEKITGVPAAKIVEATRLFFTEKPGTWMGTASNFHSSNANQNFRAIQTLVAMSGNLDVEGGVTFPTYPLPFDGFATSPAFTRWQELLPKMADKRVDKQYFPVWWEKIEEIQVNRLPEYVRDGQIKAGVFFGVNAMMWPQSHLYQEAFKNMEFAATADYFYRPWTHDYMDMLLPAATSLERTAPFAIFGRSIYLREPVVQPLGEAKSDWDIIFQIGVKLGYPQEFWNGDVESALNFLLKPLNLTMEDLRKNPQKMVTVPPPGPEKFKKYELGLMRPDGKPGFNTPSGKVEVSCDLLKKYNINPLPVYREPIESPLSTPELAKRYPLVLNSGSRLPFYTHSKLRNIPWLREIQPDPIVRLSPTDAEARGIASGDDVVVESPRGSITMKAEVTNMVMPGATDIFHGWPQANVNELISRDFDPISGFPPFKEGLCEVRKV